MTINELKGKANQIEDANLKSDWEKVSKIWDEFLNDKDPFPDQNEMFVASVSGDFWMWLLENEPTKKNILPKQYLVSE